MSLLERIIEDRRHDQPQTVDRQRLQGMLQQCHALPPVRSLARALQSSPALIAEIKRHSPSHQTFPGFRDPQDLALAYQRHGAVAVSVLTNEKYFGMRKSDLSNVTAAIGIPVLRKEFIISEFDVLESRLLGADAVLLIVRLLNDVTLATLAGLAGQIGLEVLLEVHNAAELERALALEPGIIGVNARNLDTMEMDLPGALRLACRVPRGILVVAESGIGGRSDINRYLEHGVNSFLIGTELLRHENPEQRLAALLAREDSHGAL